MRRVACFFGCVCWLLMPMPTASDQPVDFNRDIRPILHDEDLDVDTDFCAMCGHDWCSVRISKEIEMFVSGKDDDYQWDKAKVTAALSPDQQTILAQRGVLSPDEIHRLASKTKKAVTREDDPKATCHSDYVDTDEAKRIQEQVAAV